MKKVLVISSVPTPPVFAGNQKCISEYCELLKSLGCDVHFLYVQGREKADDRLREYWGDRLHVYSKIYFLEGVKRAVTVLRAKIYGYNRIDDLYPIGLSHYVSRIQNEHSFDAIIINYVSLSKLFSKELHCKKILFTHDCMSFKKLRLGLKRFWFDLTPDEEAKGLQRSDALLSIQENESVYFQYLHPKGTVVTVYSCFKTTILPLAYNKNILFLSGKSILNVKGITYFINEIWPLVTRRDKEAKLIIGGSICDILTDMKAENITLFGRVDDKDDFYRLGDICINPIYQGTGLKIKTFESLSYGRVTIVHPHSAEGIFNPQDAPIIKGGSPSEFAEYVLCALNDMQMREEYSCRGIKYIEKLNSHIKTQYEKLLFDK